MQKALQWRPFRALSRTPRLFIGAALATSLGAANAADAPKQGYLGELTAITVGTFSTLEHAQRDARYGVAEAEIVRVWPDRQDGVWLYQEQALIGESAATVDAAMKAKPYFLRVIHSVETAPGVVTRTVHRLNDPSKALGAWKSKTPLAGLSPADLADSECTITVERVAEKFWRSTSAKCPNAYKGASYAISMGVAVDGQYANWDRGFAADQTHVWGPATGGYIFKRVK
ncbi:MAG: chromophore lyase CpcT/CpeT [Parvularculaceae bacterium]|nr:chromophore lyase CpcT/CpeT [Parvularculaceae bacterium]